MDRQRIGLWGTVIFATAAVIGVFVQLFLIGSYIFGETGALDVHKDLGKLVHLCYVLTFFSALIGAWPNWRRATLPFALAVLGSVQAFLAGGGSDVSGYVHAFHAALVPAVFLLAFLIGLRAYQALGGADSEPGIRPASG